MSLESEFFQRLRPDPERLEKYGFRQCDGSWIWTGRFMDGTFRAELRVSSPEMNFNQTDGQVHLNRKWSVTGKIIDCETEEEYAPLHVGGLPGAFIGEVKDEYTALLRRIADACFTTMPFSGDQANRIAQFIFKSWGEAPDFPFEGDDSIGVFRHPDNRKWYAVFLHVPFHRLKKNACCSRKGTRSGIQEEKENSVDILNIKSSCVQELLARSGFFPCYHMNKRSWISVLLDGSVPDEDVTFLLNESRKLVSRKKRIRLTGSGHAWWLVPCNHAYFDVGRGFAENNGVLLWKQAAAVASGDIACLYMGAPVSAILWICRVSETDIPCHSRCEQVHAKKLMRLQLLHSLTPEEFPLKKLRVLGVTSVRSQRELAPLLVQELNQVYACAKE